MNLQSQSQGPAGLGLPGHRSLVLALADFRREWEEAAGSRSLLMLETPVGLILSDIVERLGLTPQERELVLGSRLENELDNFVHQRVSHLRAQ